MRQVKSREQVMTLDLSSQEIAALSELIQAGGNMALFDPAKRKTLEQLAGVLGIAVTGSQLIGEPETVERLPALTNGASGGVDETLKGHFVAQTKLCWDLLKVDGLPVVQQLLPTYLPALEALAQQSSRYQKIFAGLAAQGCMLAGLVAVLQLNNPVAEAYCKQAVQYSRLAGDRNLEVAALKHLATKYNDAKYPVKTLQTYQEALPLVNEVSPLLHSRTYLGLALASAQCGQKQEALRYLGLALETFPERPEDDPSFVFADCGPSSLNHYGGLIYQEFDEPEKAWEMFAGVETLRSKIVIPERTFIEIVNCQTEAAVAQRDLDRACVHIQIGVTGALKVKSEMRFNEVFSIYRQMKIIWPHESRVKALADLFHR
jgi:tetratricopeptide (TPR) repeat protein